MSSPFEQAEVTEAAPQFVNPMARGLAEVAYQVNQPFVLDTSKFSATFDTSTTPLVTAVADTAAWYRTQDGR